MSDIFAEPGTTIPTQESQETTPVENGTPTNQPVGVEYNGKVWTQDDIIKKFQSADDHIKTLEEQNVTLAEQVTKGATLDDVLTKMEQKQTPTPVEPTTTPVAEVDVETVAMNAYQKIKRQEQMETNVAVATDKLTKLHGDGATKFLQDKAAEVGMSVQEAKDLAATKPLVFDNLFISKQEKPVHTATGGNINTQTLNQGTGNKSQKPLGKMSNKERVAHALNLAKQING